MKCEATAAERRLAATRQVKTATTGLLKLSKNRKGTEHEFQTKRGRVLKVPEICVIAFVYSVDL